MATSLQRAMWDDQDERYGSPDDVQGWLDKAADFEAQYGTQPSAWERMRQIDNKMHGITPNLPNYKKPAGPIPFDLPFNTDQFLVASNDGDDLTLDYFLDQGKIHNISASSGLDEMIPMLVGAMSKFPNATNLAQTGMEYGYDLLDTWNVGDMVKRGLIQGAANTQGVSPEDILANVTIETLQDPAAQAGDYKEDQPGLIGALLSQGENLGAQGNTTGVYGGVPQLLNLIDNIQGTGVQGLQSFFQGLGGILGLGEGDIENVKQAARDVDEDDLAKVYT